MVEYREFINHIATLNDDIALTTFSFQEVNFHLADIISRKEGCYKIPKKALKIKSLVNNLDLLKDKINIVFDSLEDLNNSLGDDLDEKKRKRIIEATLESRFFVSDFFAYNSKYKLINKDIDSLPLMIKNTEGKLYDSMFVDVFLRLEIYTSDVYSKFKIIEKNIYDLKNIKIFSSFAGGDQARDENIREKIDRIKKQYLSLGKEFTFSITDIENPKNIVSDENDDWSSDLPELGTSQIVNQVLLNVSVVEQSGDKICFTHNSNRIIGTLERFDQEGLDLNLIISTLEYFRLRRNVIVHRKHDERFSGSFEAFVTANGKKINDFWSEILPRKNNHAFLDFSDSDVTFSDFWIIIDALNIIRRIAFALNAVLCSTIPRNYWIYYFSKKYNAERISSGKPILDLSVYDIRNYRKFLGYANKQTIDIFTEEELKEVFIKK